MFEENGIYFKCNGWKILFSIKEPVFKELCVELFSAVSFEANMVDHHFSMALVFRLSSQYRECNLTEFAWRMGLYEQHEAMSPIFL